MRYLSKNRRRANFHCIEMELRYYQTLKKQIEDFRSDIIEGTQHSDVSVHTGPGNTVLSKVMRLTASPMMLETERRVQAIEWALDQTKTADPERVKLVELKYFDNKLRDEGIADRLHISRTTFYRWRRDFVALVAERLGWEV